MDTPSLVYPARLDLPPDRMFAGDGEFRENRLEWLQPNEFWTLIHYQHSNAVTINARTFAVEQDTLVLFAPGCRGAHTRIGPGTDFAYLTFNLPSHQGRRYALPAVFPKATEHAKNMLRTVAKVSGDLLPAKSFAWSFCLLEALDPVFLRQHEALYSAEEFIRNHLHADLRVPDIAEFAQVSPRQLLRMFREEHRLTVQEFVRKRRTHEACRLLTTTTRPIKVIAEQVGIPDLAQFNKVIRKETGVSPRAFRAMGER